MTLNEARFVWKNRSWYSQEMVNWAIQILTEAGEL